LEKSGVVDKLIIKLSELEMIYRNKELELYSQKQENLTQLLL